jgi:5'-phosphate synthase pdxT subunit
VFIRAPRIVRCGPAVEVLARRGPDPVLVRSGPVLGTCFHPELQPDHWVTREFAHMVRRCSTAVAR